MLQGELAGKASPAHHLEPMAPLWAAWVSCETINSQVTGEPCLQTSQARSSLHKLFTLTTLRATVVDERLWTKSAQHRYGNVTQIDVTSDGRKTIGNSYSMKGVE